MTRRIIKRTPVEISRVFGDVGVFWGADSFSDDGPDCVSAAPLSAIVLNCSNVNT